MRSRNVERVRTALSLAANLLIVVLTAYSVSTFFTIGGEGNMTVGGSYCFMFFTVDSNILAAVAALVLLIAELPVLAGKRDAPPVWAAALKFTGTAAVGVTFFTVMLFLGPMAGYGNLLAGANLFMHLITPLLAMISLCLLEPQPPLRLRCALLGLLPTFLYACVYMYMVVIVRRWFDFYGFNMGGLWSVTFVLMHAAAFLLCLALWVLRNRAERKEAALAA